MAVAAEWIYVHPAIALLDLKKILTPRGKLWYGWPENEWQFIH
jgi:hypothetical protein